MLGYLAGPSWGARIYNAIHSYVTPATLAVTSILLGSPVLLPFALIWFNHIGVDRLLGYGLKYPAGFGWTHLGRMGKKRRGCYFGELESLLIPSVNARITRPTPKLTMTACSMSLLL